MKDEQNQPESTLPQILKQFVVKICTTISSSFLKASRGEESLNALTWWGVIIYIFSLFILETRILPKISFLPLAFAIDLTALLFFIWHIYVIRKCLPKEAKLSKEDKKIIALQNRLERPQKILRKIFLQEAMFNIKNSTILVILDLFFIISYLQKIILLTR